MGSYRTEILHSAEKETRKINKEHLKRIVDVIDALSENPFPKHAKKLAGSRSSYRIRISNYRILYEVNKSDKVITIYHILHRKNAYRKS